MDSTQEHSREAMSASAASDEASLEELQTLLKARVHELKKAKDDADLKAATKQALQSLLKAVAAAPKQALTEEERRKIDSALLSESATLKWSLLRALEHSDVYRAFLGLPATMEATRQFLTQISAAKLTEIMGNLQLSDSVQELVWVEQVLNFMTGDGRRKHELNGFVLKNKGPVRGALNRVVKHRKELEVASKKKHAAPSQPIEYEMERDVRLIDQERNETRAADLGAMIDQAVTRKK